MRNRRGLNRIGILAIALIIALGAVGVTYGAWTDEIYVTGTFSTGNITTGLACGAHSSEVSCPVSGMTMDITVSEPPDGTYYCDFTVSNASGSFPIEIDDLELSGEYTGVTTEITDDLELGDQIDPGDDATGTVYIYVDTDTDYYEQNNIDLEYTLTVDVRRWNE